MQVFFVGLGGRIVLKWDNCNFARETTIGASIGLRKKAPGPELDG